LRKEEISERQSRYASRRILRVGAGTGTIELNAANESWLRPNNAFKPKLHRYAVHMAGTACHMASYALQFGLT
jgi:hypothetical protein